MAHRESWREHLATHANEFGNYLLDLMGFEHQVEFSKEDIHLVTPEKAAETQPESLANLTEHLCWLDKVETKTFHSSAWHEEGQLYFNEADSIFYSLGDSLYAQDHILLSHLRIDAQQAGMLAILPDGFYHAVGTAAVFAALGKKRVPFIRAIGNFATLAAYDFLSTRPGVHYVDETNQPISQSDAYSDSFDILKDSVPHSGSALTDDRFLTERVLVAVREIALRGLGSRWESYDSEFEKTGRLLGQVFKEIAEVAGGDYGYSKTRAARTILKAKFREVYAVLKDDEFWGDPLKGSDEMIVDIQTDDYLDNSIGSLDWIKGASKEEVTEDVPLDDRDLPSDYQASEDEQRRLEVFEDFINSL